MNQASSNYRELYDKLVKLYKQSQRMPTNGVLERQIARMEELVPPKIREAAMMDAYTNSIDYGKLLDFEFNNRIDGMDRDEILELVYTRKEVPDQPFQHLFAPRKDNVQLFVVKGDSMSPTLRHGEQVAVYRTTTVYENKVSLIELAEGKFLKRIKADGDGYLLISDNPKHKTMFVAHGGLRVLGIVTHKIDEV